MKNSGRFFLRSIIGRGRLVRVQRTQHHRVAVSNTNLEVVYHVCCETHSYMGNRILLAPFRRRRSQPTDFQVINTNPTSWNLPFWTKCTHTLERVGIGVCWRHQTATIPNCSYAGGVRSDLIRWISTIFYIDVDDNHHNTEAWTAMLLLHT
jgi:hypothetical protein